MATALPRRQDVPQAFTWDVESIFESPATWEIELKRLMAAIPELERFKGHLGESGQILLQALTERNTLRTAVRKVGTYADLRRATDETDETNVTLSERASNLQAQFAAATSYFQPEILMLTPEQLATFERQAPELSCYQHYFDKLGRLRGHIRSAEVEGTLALASDVIGSPARIRSALENADLKFGTIRDEQGQAVQIAPSNHERYEQNPQREVRKAGWETYADGFLSMKHTLAACLAGAIKRDVFFARVRSYPSAFEAAMHTNDIPVAVYENLIETFRRNLPTWHRYWQIRRKALGVDQLHAYDIRVPLTRVNPVVPFEQGVDMICAGMQALGDEYVGVMRRGLLEERWVDRYGNIGKRSGAFSSGTYGTRPFILMSYNDNLFAVSTLAHELGHSMHSYYARRTQPPIYSEYSLFVAETASNFNQALVRAHLLQTVQDRDFRMAVLDEAMSNFHRYFFLMPTLARFEFDVHQCLERGEALTAANMSAKLVELFREGYGPNVVIDEPRVGITWAQFGHLYANFYVYQYATGISAANALAATVLSEGQPAAERYLEFLKAGGSLYPIEALKLAGIDMLSPAPVERAFAVFASLVDQIEMLVNEA